MTAPSTQYSQDAQPLTTVDEVLQEGRGGGGGGGGGGSRPKSRTCGYIVQVSAFSPTTGAVSTASSFNAIKCPPSAACAYSGPYIGCIDSTNAAETTKQPVPTTCIDSVAWERDYYGSTSVPRDTTVCSNYSRRECQVVNFLQAGNTFTGYICEISAATTPMTLTSGSWEYYPPTSIPTPIDGLYHFANGLTGGTASPTAAGSTTTTSSAAASRFGYDSGSAYLAGLVMLASIFFNCK
ncbi:hypothetical protein TWF694_006433 [Orbilia ellipsospora]|uniref:Uncharacterized protein n=1 Tax=Orbilia ellipsospora TaxID=2528407 RepID=A0AAV9XK47_9PEZI